MLPRQTSSFQLPPLTPFARNLMIAIGAIFLIQVLVRVILGFDTVRYAQFVEIPLGLSGAGFFGRLFLWQPFTYFWLSPLHSVGPIFFSLLSLYFFVPPIERQIGKTRTLIAFVSAGVTGGLLSLAVAGIFLPKHALYTLPLLGPQAATAGLIATLCWWWRDSRMNLFIIQPYGWQVLVGFTALVVLQGLLSAHPYLIVHQLGGILMGIGVATGRDPYGLFQRIRLWRLRRRVRVVRSGKDDRDWMN